jgi:hypothetical protein
MFYGSAYLDPNYYNFIYDQKKLLLPEFFGTGCDGEVKDDTKFQNDYYGKGGGQIFINTWNLTFYD